MMIGQKGNKDPENCPPYKGFKLPNGATLSLSSPVRLSACTLLFQ